VAKHSNWLGFEPLDCQFFIGRFRPNKARAVLRPISGTTYISVDSAALAERLQRIGQRGGPQAPACSAGGSCCLTSGKTALRRPNSTALALNSGPSIRCGWFGMMTIAPMGLGSRLEAPGAVPATARPWAATLGLPELSMHERDWPEAWLPEATGWSRLARRCFGPTPDLSGQVCVLY